MIPQRLGFIGRLIYRNHRNAFPPRRPDGFDCPGRHRELLVLQGWYVKSAMNDPWGFCGGRQLTIMTFTAYNKWHETELERWLSDHDVPYPTPADRKDLEKLIESNWNDIVVAPYNLWDTDRLSNYLKAKGLQTEGAAKANKESLLSQVQGTWYETGDQAQNAYLNVKDWILDSWTDSQLKAFADKHSIPGMFSITLKFPTWWYKT